MIAPQPFFRERGTPFSVLHRIRAMLTLGCRIDLVTYPFGEDPGLDGLTIHRTRRPPGVDDVIVGPSVAKALLDVPLFVRSIRMARTGEFDVLHTHEEAGAVGAWISRRYGIPHVYDMHSSLPQQFGNFERFNWSPVVGVFRILERYILAGSEGVITVCRELQERIEAAGFEGPTAMIENTLDVSPPAYDASGADDLLDRLGLASSHRVVLYTGTFEPYQGLELLVESIPRVLSRVPAVRFVLVGGSPSQIARLGEHAAEMGVEEAVVLVPRVPPERVFLFHRIADTLVTTRIRGTNTPLKIYQYLRSGLPIVATDVESHTQVLTDATAELVSPDPDDIARGILEVLQDSDRAESLGEAAVHLARERYSEKAYMEKLTSLLDSLPLDTPSGMTA